MQEMSTRHIHIKVTTIICLKRKKIMLRPNLHTFIDAWGAPDKDKKGSKYLPFRHKAGTSEHKEKIFCIEIR